MIFSYSLPFPSGVNRSTTSRRLLGELSTTIIRIVIRFSRWRRVFVVLFLDLLVLPAADMKVVFPGYPVAQGQLCAFKLAKQVAHLVGGNVIAGEHQGLNGPGRQRVIAAVIAEVPKTDE
ncbi:hypothetical protein D3C78_1647340 [compost metagenome]